jgi:hypothetical protein
MKNTIMVLVVSMTLFSIFLFGCGGGGDDGGGGGSQPSGPSFTTADFSGKSLYYATEIYQLCEFYTDGSAAASEMMTADSPVDLTLTQFGYWSVVNGVLIMSGSEDSGIRYVLINNDEINRRYKTNKYSSNGVISEVYFFYDQTTALSQAQEFVRTGKLQGVSGSATAIGEPTRHKIMVRNLMSPTGYVEVGLFAPSLSVGDGVGMVGLEDSTKVTPEKFLFPKTIPFQESGTIYLTDGQCDSYIDLTPILDPAAEIADKIPNIGSPIFFPCNEVTTCDAKLLKLDDGYFLDLNCDK